MSERKISPLHWYRRTNKKSGIEKYRIEDDYIVVRYLKEPNYIYVYDYQMPGKEIVDRMKILACEGKGLHTYIWQNGNEYAERIEIIP